MQPTPDIPVLIIGAGPTGLMLACQLAIRRIPFRIIDQRSGPSEHSKALVVQARTLEILEQMGLEQAARKGGHAATGLNFMVQGRWIQNINLQGIGEGKSPFPFMYILEQSKTERLLLDFLTQYHLEVEWDTELVSLTQTDSEVKVVLQYKDVTEKEVVAHWVVGADGASSDVRKQLNIPFIGGTYEHTFLVADTEVNWNFNHQDIFICLTSQTLAAFFPMSGENRFRVVSILPPQYHNQENIGFTPIARELEKTLGFPVKFKNTSWYSTYKVHHRYAEQFMVGRCFLAGDAGHIHSPAGGQGMNTGLQDAYNLAWKLALVQQEGAGEELLKTYDRERLPIAKNLVKTTDQAFKLMVSSNPLIRYFRLFFLPTLIKKLFRNNKAKAKIFERISQIGIAYRKSPLSVFASDANHFPENTPLPGDRVPYIFIYSHDYEKQVSLYSLLRNPYFTLLIFKSTFSTDRAEQLEEDLEDALSNYLPGLVKIHIIAPHPYNHAVYELFGINEDAFYLVRPDNYIGFRSQPADVDTLLNYLDEALHLKAE